MTIYELTNEHGLMTYHYFISEQEAIDYAYDKLNAQHDYEFTVVERVVPADHFTGAAA